MKRILALVLAMVIAIIPMSFTVSADDSGLIVDLSLDNYATDGVKNAVAGNETDFSWSVAPATLGSFANIEGGKTSYLQFGTPDGNGSFTPDSTKNALRITDSDFLGTGAGTVSFWYYLENSGATDYNYHMKFTNGSMMYGLGTYSAANETFFAGSHNPYGKLTKAWKYITVTKSYNETDKQWEFIFYINNANWLGKKITKAADSAEDTGYYYEFGAGIPAKFAGIKIYDKALTQAEIEAVYNAEKTQYEAFVETETEMKLVSPDKNGVLSRNGGELTLKFNSIPDKDTLSGITLTKAGDSTDLLTAKTVDAENKAVKVSYDAPDSTYSYVLNVDGVKSISNLSMTQAVTLNYTVGTSLAVSVDMSEAGVSNTGSDTGASVTVQGSPEYKTFVNANGAKTEYMQFGVVPEGATSGFDGTSKSNAIKIESDAVNNAKEGTITFWANPDANMANYTWANNLYLSYSSEEYLSTLTGASTQALFALQPYAYRNSCMTTVVSGADHTPFYEDASGTWRKLTVTWKKVENAWEVKLYHNSSSMITKNLAKEIDVTDWVLRVGYGYPGKISDIKVYDEVRTLEQITAAYNAEKSNYTEFVETETEMKLVSPENNDVISCAGGKLALTFNSIPESTTLSGITLTKAGSETNLITNTEVDTATKTVKVTYPTLDSGASYILKVSGVESITGLEMSAAKEINLVASSDISVDVKISQSGAVNAGSDQAATVTVNGAPAYGSFDNENGTQTPYFQMGVTNNSGGFVGTTKDNYITVKSDAINLAKEGTLVFWAEQDVSLAPYAWAGNTYLQYGVGSDWFFILHPSYGDNSRFNFGKASNDNGVYAKPTDDNGGDNWYQVSLAWKYDDASSKWSGRVYTDGGTEVALETTIEKDLTDAVFKFGYGYPGKMSGIKIYDTAKSAAEIKALYEAEKGNYTAYVDPGYVEMIGEVTFTDEKGSVISSFAGKTSVTASFMVLNVTPKGQDILPVLAIYEGERLKKLDIGEAKLVGSNATGDFTVTLDLSDIELKENQTIKLLVWESFSSIKPIFETEPLYWGAQSSSSQEGLYVYEYSASEALNPATVSKNNLFLSDADGVAIEAKDVYYLPSNNTIKITAENAFLAPCVLSSANVMTLDGSDAAISNTVYPYIEKTPSADSVEVISVRYYKDNTIIYEIANNSDLRVIINVANTTDINYSSLPYKVTINGDLNRVVNEGTLRIESESTETIAFELGETMLSEGEELVVVF